MPLHPQDPQTTRHRRVPATHGPETAKHEGYAAHYDTAQPHRALRLRPRANIAGS